MTTFKRFADGPRPWLVAGIIILLIWAGWWTASVLAHPLPRLVSGSAVHPDRGITYILIWPFLGLDFHHNYAAVSSWLHGANPYLHISGDPMNQVYIYPPLTLVAFLWVAFFPPESVSTRLAIPRPDGDFTFSICFPAIFLWMAAIVVIVGFAAWHSWRVRQRLGLPPLPLPFLWAAALISYPVMFELERGNCNVLPLLGIAVLVLALGSRQRLAGDVVAGLSAAAATGIKPYAVILFLGLVALRRYRAAGVGLGAFALLVLALRSLFVPWFEIFRSSAQLQTAGYMDFSHSLVVHWPLMWTDLGLPAVARVPAVPVVGGLVLLVILWVSWRMFRSRPAPALAWPYLLWLTTMATLFSSVAHDYGLLCLPLAVLAAWDRRDSWRTQLCVLPMLLWWQPLYIGLSGLPWLLIKVASILLIGQLVVRRSEVTIPPANQAARSEGAGSPVSAVPA
ncbi:MAG TPA: glycosyltransferase family 87 protein [Opitutaceae bacterium]|nr:glycosyltransferase family 87 protein [Opitutaceae bacterium]